MKALWAAIGLILSAGYGSASDLCKQPGVFSIELQRPFRHESGFMYLATIGASQWRIPTYLKHRLLGNLLLHPGDTADLNRSTAILCEELIQLGPAHSDAAEIKDLGHGRYQHWHASGIFFSTSDGSDPNRNGRLYRALEP